MEKVEGKSDPETGLSGPALVNESELPMHNVSLRWIEEGPSGPEPFLAPPPD